MDQKKSGFQPLAFTLTVVAVMLRLLPHPPNFAPVGAVALFGGARLKGWQAYAVPLLAMVATDPILSYMAGFPAYSWGSLVVYGAFMISVLLGRLFLRNNANPALIGAVTVAGSLQFFAITNFAVWAGAHSMYAHTMGGLVECYTMALPFLGRTMLADLFYTAVLFGAYAFLNRFAHEDSGQQLAA